MISRRQSLPFVVGVAARRRCSPMTLAPALAGAEVAGAKVGARSTRSPTRC